MNNCSIISVQEGVQMHTRDCPNCGKALTYSTRSNLTRAIRNNKMCISCKCSQKMTEEHKKYLSEKITGFKHTDEAKRKITESQIGRRHTDESRIQMSLSSGGTGDIDKLNNPIRRPGPLKRLRKECLERDNHACVYCGKHDGPLHAHHILSWIKHPNHRFFLNNLITLCQPCHIEEHRINGNI